MNIKKLSGYFLRYFLAIFIFVSSFIFKPMVSEAKSANTLAGLRADLKDLEAQKRANDNQKSLTQGQINSNKNAINNANQEIDNSRKKIEDAKVLIEETNNKITSESIEFTYETEDVVIKDYFDNIDDIRYAVFSYSVLTEEERVELGNEYRYLDNMLAYVFDSSLENSDIYADYNLFDDRAKDNFLKYGSLSNIESNLIAFKNNGCNICNAYAKYYGYQISEILIYSNSETINSVFNILKDTNSMVLTNKLFTYPNVFYDKEALRKLYRDKNISAFYGNEDFIKNIKLFDSYKCDINKLMIKSFMYFTISNEVIKSGIKNLELYSVDIKKGLRNLSCFATNNQADNMDKFIELGCFDYAVNNVSRLSIPVDSLMFYKLKFIKQNGIDINEYAYGAGLSSSITYDNKEFRLGDNAIKDKESARTLTRTYTMPIMKGSIYEKCEELLIKDNNNDVNIIFKLESKLIDLLDKKYLVYEDDGIDRIPNTRLYNVNGVNVSRYKVLRYLNTLRKNNIEIDSNILTYVMNRNSINTYEEFNLIKDEITRLYSDTKERSV